MQHATERIVCGWLGFVVLSVELFVFLSSLRSTNANRVLMLTKVESNKAATKSTDTPVPPANATATSATTNTTVRQQLRLRLLLEVLLRRAANLLEQGIKSPAKKCLPAVLAAGLRERPYRLHNRGNQGGICVQHLHNNARESERKTQSEIAIATKTRVGGRERRRETERCIKLCHSASNVLSDLCCSSLGADLGSSPCEKSDCVLWLMSCGVHETLSLVYRDHVRKTLGDGPASCLQ